MRFEASVSGTNVPGVMWSLVPPIGTMSNGLYTAPSTISSPQAVTVVARSMVDPSKAASATIYLASTVGIAVTPASVAVTAGQSVQFSPSIAGTQNTSVSWSLTPAIGTINNGFYTAPAMVETLQTILLTVASLADPSQTAQASITVRPSRPSSISISPAQITLGPSQSKQFNATIQGGTSAVTWSISPSIGHISASGLYTAPSGIPEQQTVVVSASIADDPGKVASAIVTLAAPSPPPPLPPIQLPIEVVGLDGKTVTTSFNVPQGANLTGAVTLSMRIHGLRSGLQASVEVNSTGWRPINSSTVTLLGNAAAYGGIGGGFSTISMTMSLPAGAIAVGTNLVSFRFNGTDGRVSGFRVLNFNLQGSDGSSLLPGEAFVYEDPNAWQPPSSQASDIAAGKALWYQAPLSKPTPNGPVPIQARCTDCHAQDGRDLKYFNYSNNSIRTRSMFHGLTAQQGDQIASYIRSLNIPNPGRPWNPPYQPGPGLDSQPVANWAAGGGIDSVVDTDQQTLDAIFPAGVQATVFSPAGNLNAREIPVSFQLPDWNQWLPGTHPKDAWGSAFANGSYNALYQTIRSQLNVLDPVAYTAQRTNIDNWHLAAIDLITQQKLLNPNTQQWSPDFIDALYSTPQWGMVKLWEIMNEFQLQGFSQNMFGAQADPRAWYAYLPFLTSPHMLQLPVDRPGVRNGTMQVVNYLAFTWYHLQLILDNGNKKQPSSGTPIDWQYTYGYINTMAKMNGQMVGLYYLWLIKAAQISNNGIGPEFMYGGWSWTVNDVSLQVASESFFMWPGVPASTRTALHEASLSTWFNTITKFTPQQFYTGGWTTPGALPVHGQPYGNFPDRIWWMIPRFAFLGVNPTLVNQVADWAKTIWPNGNWDADKTATCSYSGSYINCSTDQ